MASFGAPSYSRIASRILKEYSQVEVVDLTEYKRSVWLDNDAIYVNRETGKVYQPHNEDEAGFVFSDNPRRVCLKGGEGSGKSVAGIIKSLERIRRGMSGIMGSPNFVHFKKSLWPEFRRWCPINALVPKHRHRLDVDWQPNQPFELVFVNGATVLCGGFDSPGSWEGPNINWAMFDEARHHPTAAMIKVLDGRCRIAGPNGEPPQLWVTTTPRKSKMSNSPDDSAFHWLYEMFGPWTDTEKEDPYRKFKLLSKVITLRLSENAENLADGYADVRSDSLIGSEEAILVNAEWADEENLERFIHNIALWDACKIDYPMFSPRDPVVIALDAATGRTSSASDNFALLGISPHPTVKDASVFRFLETWRASTGRQIDFIGTDSEPGPETSLRKKFKEFNVYCVCFDQYQLISTAQRLESECEIWFDSFGQVDKRLKADRSLLDSIVRKTVGHDGNITLKNHIDNADRKVDDSGSKFRIVKGRGPVDGAVCLSMADWQVKHELML